MTDTISFDRLEDWSLVNSIDGETRKEVIVSFRTRQSGIVQMSYRRVLEERAKLSPATSSEPNIHVFTDAEKTYMEYVSAIVWRIVFDSHKPDFDSMQKV